jgi:hypothetical protein
VSLFDLLRHVTRKAPPILRFRAVFVSKDSFGGGVGCNVDRKGTVDVGGGSLVDSANMTVLNILGCCLGCCVCGVVALVLGVLLNVD